MRSGNRGRWSVAGRVRTATIAAAVLLVVAMAAPPVSAQPGAVGAQVPEPSPGDAPGEHADGGELPAEVLSEALRDATPEELERRRVEVARRLEEAGSAEEFVRRLEEGATEALAELDAELESARLALVEARAEAEEARAELADANASSARASTLADAAEADLRDAAVDMFINPPQADSVRAALSGTVEEEMASTGLLVGRAELRRQVSRQRDRALAAASKAARDADRASRAAQAASEEVEEATEELSAKLEAQTIEVLRIRAELAAARSEVADLQLTDSVLATRLALGSLATSGAVTARRDASGNWVPDVEGLPTRADMVRIGDTDVWVHRLVAPNVLAMFLAALGDGVVLAGSAHRDSLRQNELRASHCGTSYEAIFTAPSSSCSPPTARPGQSMHERGLAIDFTEGGRVLTRSSASFAWLSEHAAEYGFFNLPSEPWHWSVNGR
ncbi:MAG: M15 family metallopeptidase [Microthrixaceae bacterium]